MKNRKKENEKRRRREKRIEPVQSSNIEFEHLIPVTNMSNLSFEKGKKTIVLERSKKRELYQ